MQPPGLWEFNVIETIQHFRTPFLDGFFIYLNFFDTYTYYFLLIGIVWVGYSYKFGSKFFFILIIAFFLNVSIKGIFEQLRPFELDPNLKIIDVSGYSFPSGGGQSAALLGLLLIHQFKKYKVAWLFAGAYFFLISLSRLYLGVHFPRDVFVGWLSGLFLFGIFIWGFPIIEKIIHKLKPLKSLLIFQGILLIFWIFTKNNDLINFLSGGSLAIYFSYKYNLFLNDAKSFKEFIIRSVYISISSILILQIAYLSKHNIFLYMFFNYLAIFWIGMFSSYFLKKTKLLQKLLK